MEVVFLTFILVLSIFLGFELISKVPATLHTPLMSGANAISGIAIVGALMAANARLDEGDGRAAALLGVSALVLARTCNGRGGVSGDPSPEALPGDAGDSDSGMW